MSRLGKVWRWLGDWQRSAFILRSPLIRIVPIIPAIGYLLIYSDAIGEFLSSHDTLGPSLFTNPIVRMHWIYLGACLLLVVLLVFIWRCPPAIKRYHRSDDYVIAALGFRKPGQFSEAVFDALDAASPEDRLKALENVIGILRNDGNQIRAFHDLLRASFERKDYSDEMIYQALRDSLMTVGISGTPICRRRKYLNDFKAIFLSMGRYVLTKNEQYAHALSLFEYQYASLRTGEPEFARFCAVFAWIGAGLIILPALETFVRVLMIIDALYRSAIIVVFAALTISLLANWRPLPWLRRVRPDSQIATFEPENKTDG